MLQLREERELTETAPWVVNYYPAEGNPGLVEFLLDPPEELTEDVGAETEDGETEPGPDGGGPEEPASPEAPPEGGGAASEPESGGPEEPAPAEAPPEDAGDGELQPGDGGTEN